jgi:hypothetical protein
MQKVSHARSNPVVHAFNGSSRWKRSTSNTRRIAPIAMMFAYVACKAAATQPRGVRSPDAIPDTTVSEPASSGPAAQHTAVSESEEYAGSCDYNRVSCIDSYVGLSARTVRSNCNGTYSTAPCTVSGRSGRCAFRGPRDGDTYVMHYYTPLDLAMPDCLRLRGEWTPR